MKTQYLRCWVLLLAAAFLVLWCASIGVTYSASEAVLQEQAAAQAAAAPVRDELGIRMIGILGWGLIGLGFLGVALTVVFSGKPRRRRRGVHSSGTVRRSSHYSRYPNTAYRNRVERRY